MNLERVKWEYLPIVGLIVLETQHTRLLAGGKILQNPQAMDEDIEVMKSLTRAYVFNGLLIVATIIGGIIFWSNS